MSNASRYICERNFHDNQPTEEDPYSDEEYILRKNKFCKGFNQSFIIGAQIQANNVIENSFCLQESTT